MPGTTAVPGTWSPPPPLPPPLVSGEKRASPTTQLPCRAHARPTKRRGGRPEADARRVPSVEQPHDRHAVPHGQHDHLEARVGGAAVVEAAQGVELALLGLVRLPVRHGLVRVGHVAPAQHVVGDDEGPRPQQPPRRPGPRPAQQLLQVAAVRLLVGVEEEGVVGRVRRQPRQPAVVPSAFYPPFPSPNPPDGPEPGPEPEPEPEPGAGGRGQGRGGGGAGSDHVRLDLEPHHQAVGPDGVRPHHGRVADEEADVDDLGGGCSRLASIGGKQCASGPTGTVSCRVTGCFFPLPRLAFCIRLCWRAGAPPLYVDAPPTLQAPRRCRPPPAGAGPLSVQAPSQRVTGVAVGRRRRRCVADRTPLGRRACNHPRRPRRASTSPSVGYLPSDRRPCCTSAQPCHPFIASPSPGLDRALRGPISVRAPGPRSRHPSLSAPPRALSSFLRTPPPFLTAAPPPLPSAASHPAPADSRPRPLRPGADVTASHAHDMEAGPKASRQGAGEDELVLSSTSPYWPWHCS